MDNDSNFKDFAKFSVAGETLIDGDVDDSDDDYKKPFATETMMTTNTLVDDDISDNDNFILDEIDKEKAEAAAADNSIDEGSVNEEAGTETSMSRRVSTMSSATQNSTAQSSDSRRESTLSSGTHNEGSSSRHEYTNTYSTHDSTYYTASHRESSQAATEESVSRRESTATYESSDRTQGPDNIEEDCNDASILDEGTHTEASVSRRESAVSEASHISRRTSGRTEALIRDAARNIVNKISLDRGRDSLNAESIAEEHSCHSSARPSSAHESAMDDDHIPNEDAMSYEKPTVEDEASDDEAPAADEGGENSSHHENEDDIFSDNSPRSSIGSLSENEPRKISSVTHRSPQRSRSPRFSGVSDLSRLDDDRDEDFIPTIRGTPRPAFRSPSSVKALQMSSPPVSAHGTPRSSRRTPLPTVSRLGSPSLSAQYSPKKTPPRFKRSTPPLVLLHATLLPLRWPWGDVLDNTQTDDLSPNGKSLRDAWRQLQDRMGDTTCERGILLPHPQNDFEVLEERLLEALELPLRRRARILDCGHYLGPSNEMTIAEEDSEDEDSDVDNKPSRSSIERKAHWCGTCRSEIKYDSLGQGKIFRVKVYASNGLMKAGAWEACWKEMERVDVELEPILEAGVQEELDLLASDQEKAMEEQERIMEEQQRDMERDMEYREYEEYAEEELVDEQEPSVLYEQPSPPKQEERRREMYGETQKPTPGPASTEHTPHQPQPSHQTGTPPSQAPKNDSLPALLLKALRVTVSDKKNIMIAVMSALVLVLALRGGQGTERDVVVIGSRPTVTVPGWTAQTVESFAQVKADLEEVEEGFQDVEPRSIQFQDELVESVQTESTESETTDAHTIHPGTEVPEIAHFESTESETTQPVPQVMESEFAASESTVPQSVQVGSSKSKVVGPHSFESQLKKSRPAKPCATRPAAESFKPAREGTETQQLEVVVSERIVTVTVTEKVYTPQPTEVEAEQPVEELVEELAGKSAEEPAEAPLEEHVEEYVEHPIEEAVEEAVGETAGEYVEESVEIVQDGIVCDNESEQLMEGAIEIVEDDVVCDNDIEKPIEVQVETALAETVCDREVEQPGKSEIVLDLGDVKKLKLEMEL